MPLHPNVRRCTHIKITGHRCGSPALKQEYFCYFHTRMIKGVQTRVDSEIHPVALIENAEAIQAALMHMIDAVLKGTIDIKRANIVLKALHIAVRNSKNVYFHIRPDDMVREVPNYAAQYLTEHPEQNAPQPNPHVAPDALVRPAQPNSAASTQNLNPENQAQEKTENLNPPGANDVPTPPQPAPNHEPCQTAAKRRQNTAQGANRGNKPENHQAPEERKRSCDPLPAPSAPNSRNSLPSPKAKADTTPPLINRQSERWQEIKNLEASIEGAMHGNWQDLRTVFNAVGLTPRKPPASQKTAPAKKVIKETNIV